MVFSGILAEKMVYGVPVIMSAPSPAYETSVDESGVVRNTRYVFANGERLVEIADNGSKTYYLNDHLGSSSVTVNQQGQVVDRLAYYPFGDIKSGGSATKYGYNSKELDSTGLNYYGARYYNSVLKRWTQADTMLPNMYDPQQLNRYSYVSNNPFKYTDPNGRNGVELVALFLATTAAVIYVALGVAYVGTAASLSITPPEKSDNADQQQASPSNKEENNDFNQYVEDLNPHGTTVNKETTSINEFDAPVQNDKKTTVGSVLPGCHFGETCIRAVDGRVNVEVIESEKEDVCGSNVECREYIDRYYDTKDRRYRVLAYTTQAQDPSPDDYSSSRNGVSGSRTRSNGESRDFGSLILRHMGIAYDKSK